MAEKQSTESKASEVCTPAGTRLSDHGGRNTVEPCDVPDSMLPAMPIVSHGEDGASYFPHRPHDEWPLFTACVARLLDRAEIARRKEPQEAVKLEGDNPRLQGGLAAVRSSRAF